MINKSILLEYKEPMLHSDMMKYLDILNTRYRFLRIIYIGRSPHGKSIPIIKIGIGEKNIIYTAGVNGREMLTSILLMRFINEFSELLRTEQRVYNIGVEYIFKTRSIYIAPMINPDSIENYGFENDDRSQPDIRPIIEFGNTLNNIKLLMTLRSNGDYITCPDINEFHMKSTIKLFARMTSCKITDFPCVYDIMSSKKTPIFDVSCDNNKFFESYMRVRELLFTAPVLC